MGTLFAVQVSARGNCPSRPINSAVSLCTIPHRRTKAFFGMLARCFRGQSESPAQRSRQSLIVDFPERCATGALAGFSHITKRHSNGQTESIPVESTC
jgi:hypothetical protein